jgi:hypothetical protein
MERHKLRRLVSGALILFSVAFGAWGWNQVTEAGAFSEAAPQADALTIRAYLPLVVNYTGAPPSMLNVPVAQQECSQWCWSGVSQMIFGYFGTPQTQCAIANYAWSRTDCCPSTTSCPSFWTEYPTAPCNNWNFMYGGNGSLQGILTHWGVNSTMVFSATTYAATKTQIQARQPVIMRWGWIEYGVEVGGHFLVLRGYNDTASTVTYNDPWDGGSYTALYTWVVEDTDPLNGHLWTHTLTNVKK